MIFYKYTKQYPKKTLTIPRGVPITLMSIGVIMLLWVAWPILSFKILSRDFFSTVITPLAEESSKNNLNFSNVVMAIENSPNHMSDYTNPNVWYPLKPQSANNSKISTYTLSIPSLGIKDASVVIAGDSLDKHLIHYGGTALPGEYGNTVIFGHSTLPALFNIKDYHTIFSTLPTLKPRVKTIPGDEIYINYDGITYKYEVYEMTVTKPSDLSPLEQRFDDSRLTLITCVPPGTYWERLNVKAILVPPQ